MAATTKAAGIQFPYRLVRVLQGFDTNCQGNRTAIGVRYLPDYCTASPACAGSVETTTYTECGDFGTIAATAKTLYGSTPFLVVQDNCNSASAATPLQLGYVYPFDACVLNPAGNLLGVSDPVKSMVVTLEGTAVAVNSFADPNCAVASLTNATTRLSNLPKAATNFTFGWESPCFSGFPYGQQFTLYNGAQLISKALTATTTSTSTTAVESSSLMSSAVTVVQPTQSSSSQLTSSSNSSGPSIPLLVGITVGVIVFLVIIITFLFCRRARNRTMPRPESTEMLAKSIAPPPAHSTVASSEGRSTSLHSRATTTTGTSEKGSVLLDEAFTRRHLAGSDAIARAGRAAALDAKTRGTNGASEPPKALPQDPSRWTPVQVSEWVSRTQDAPPRMVQFILDQEMDGRAMLAFRRGAAVEEDGGVVAVALGTLGVRILFEKVVDEFKGMVAELEGRRVLVEHEEGAAPPAYGA
ncbi:hypothetical protein BC830DRAFT_1112892 [Chytriomyces sp. MP71]|nr:hypothetical protein BC830DRAFT_1112892 [Chytriomyces sp. MP71]